MSSKFLMDIKKEKRKSSIKVLAKKARRQSIKLELLRNHSASVANINFNNDNKNDSKSNKSDSSSKSKNILQERNQTKSPVQTISTKALMDQRKQIEIFLKNLGKNILQNSEESKKGSGTPKKSVFSIDAKTKKSSKYIYIKCFYLKVII
jgi:hypothetical protein